MKTPDQQGMARRGARLQSMAPGLLALLQTARTSWVAQQLVVRFRLLLSSRAVKRLERLLAAHAPQQHSARLKALLTLLWLLEAFFAVTLLLDLIYGLSAPPLSGQSGPSFGLVFITVVMMPSLILAMRWKYRLALDEEAQLAAERQWAAHRRATDLAQAYSILYLQPGAPLHIAHAAYAAAMKKCHPDVAGGTDATAKELNWAIETIREQDGSVDEVLPASGARWAGTVQMSRRQRDRTGRDGWERG